MKKLILLITILSSMLSYSISSSEWNGDGKYPYVFPNFDFPLAEEGINVIKANPDRWNNPTVRNVNTYGPVEYNTSNANIQEYSRNINLLGMTTKANMALFGNIILQHTKYYQGQRYNWHLDNTLLYVKQNLYASTIGPESENSDFPELDDKKTSQIRMRSMFEENFTKTDILIVDGNVYGHIRIVPINGDTLEVYKPWRLEKEDFKKKSDPVAIVRGEVADNGFYGKHMTESGEEIYVIKVENYEKDEYIKTHRVDAETFENKYYIGNVDIRKYTIFAWGEHSDKKGFIPEVVPAVTMKNMISKANMLNIDTLHQRMGQRTNFGEEKSASKTGMWTRLLAAYDMESGNQFGYNQTLYGIQVGKDYELKREYDEYTLYSGVEASYIKSKSNFIDSEHNDFDSLGNMTTSAKEVAKGDTHLVGLGLYQTRIHDDGQYSDLLTEVKYVNNSSSTIEDTSASNEGVLFTINGEYGKDILKSSEKLGIEPQAQVTYTIGYFPDYTFEKNGNQFTIKQGLSHTFISRTGIRLFNKNNEKHKIWGVANLYYIPIPNTYVEVGTGQYTETFKPVYLEIGAGAQSKITDTLTLYGDVRYKANVIHNGYQNQNIKAILGVKTEF